MASASDLALAAGHPQRALVHLRRLQERIEELGLADVDLSPTPELVDVLLRVGHRDEARTRASEHLALAQRKGRPWALARAWRACEQVAEEDRLDEPFLRALDLHAQTPDDFETARTRLAYGARLRRTGRRVDAREQLRVALEVFDGLGAGLWTDGVAAELTATGERVTRREAMGVDSLTPQELQVSLLLAEGRTTRETAAALFLSPKTVEYHLRKVYTKLGIRSRAELVEALPR